MGNTDKTRENKLRLKLHRLGCFLKKDRARSRSVDHHGGYMIVDTKGNFIVAGERYNLTLGDVENWAKGK